MSRLDIGEVVDGRYEVLGGPLLGGMSEVYHARDKVTGSQVAIKIARLDANPKLAAHSADSELRALEEVIHPNVVKLMGAGVLPDHTAYLALEWLPQRLDHLVSKMGPMPWDAFFNDVGRPLISALKQAHARKIAHRDLSWKNVLLSSLDEPKITDFGIARHMNKVGIGATFKGAGTFPFTPPDQDDGMHSYGRDCWSWAAIAASCLLGKRAENMQDLKAGLMRLPEGERPEEIFHRAWADDPKARYIGAAEMSADLEAFHRKVRTLRGAVANVPLVLQPSAIQALARIYGAADPAPLQARLTAELNDHCSGSISSDGSSLTILGFETRLDASINSSDSDRLLVRDVLHMDEAVASRQRSDMVEITEFEFRIASSIYDGDRSAVRELVAFLTHGLDVLAREHERYRRERFLDACARAIAIRERRTRKGQEFRYSELRRDGDYFVAQLDEEIEADELSDSVTVIAEGGRPLFLEVASIDFDRIKLRLTSGPDRVLPASGTLQRNREPDRLQLRKQRMVLDLVRAGAAASPRLAELFRYPEQARAPERVGLFNTGLRRDIEDTIDKALGVRDFLVVNGPPGTGKTTLIANLIARYIALFPERRVLLSSQTHVALDHVLIKLREQGISSGVVRVASRGSTKVDEQVRDLRLAVQLADWISRTERRALNYMELRAKDVGLEGRQLHAILLAEEMRTRVRVRSSLEEQLRLKRSQIAHVDTVVTEKLAEGRSPELADFERETTTLNDEIRYLEQEMSAVTSSEERLRRRIREFGEFGAELASASPADLEVWIDTALPKSEEVKVLRPIVELQNKWLERLGNSRDFEPAVLSEARVVAGTCNGLAGLPAFYESTFDLCILDEASKATAVEALIPMSRARAWVVVGDPKQLPPFKDDGLEKDDEWGPELDKTVLDVLLESLPKESITSLTRQGRMCAGIGDLIASVFYPERTIESIRGDDDRQRQIAKLFPKPVTWVSTSRIKAREERPSPEKIRNPREAGVVIGLLGQLHNAFKGRAQRCSVAVIAGYAEQVKVIQQLISARHSEISSLDLQINTIDAFQGKDADVCIYSVTRSNPKFNLGFQRKRPRLNVALSRARDALVLVGDLDFCRQCSGENPFLPVISHIESHSDECEVRVHGES